VFPERCGMRSRLHLPSTLSRSLSRTRYRSGWPSRSGAEGVFTMSPKQRRQRRRRCASLTGKLSPLQCERDEYRGCQMCACVCVFYCCMYLFAFALLTLMFRCLLFFRFFRLFYLSPLFFFDFFSGTEKPPSTFFASPEFTSKSEFLLFASIFCSFFSFSFTASSSSSPLSFTFVVVFLGLYGVFLVFFSVLFYYFFIVGVFLLYCFSLFSRHFSFLSLYFALLHLLAKMFLFIWPNRQRQSSQPPSPELTNPQNEPPTFRYISPPNFPPFSVGQISYIKLLENPGVGVGHSEVGVGITAPEITN